MNGPRDEFFAGAGFAADQNRRIAAGDLGHSQQDGGERGRAADNLFEHRGLVDFLSKRDVLFPQSLLGSLAILDIGICDVPPHELSLVVAQRVGANQEPPIGSVPGPQAHLHLASGAGQYRTIDMCRDPVDVIRMNLRFTVSLTPLVESDAEIRERDSVRIQALGLGSQDADKLGREIQNLAEFTFALAQRACEDLVLRDVDAGSDEPREQPAVCRWGADAPYVTNRPVRTHDPLRELESATLRQYRPNFLRDEISVVRMHERHVFREGRCLRRRIEAVDREQLGRPLLKARRSERPASRMCEPLSLRQVELGLLAFVHVEVDPDPVEDRSVIPTERLCATEEPAVIALSVPNATTRLSGAARPQIVRPDSPHCFVIVRMQKRDMRIPRGPRVGSEAQWMILRQAEVVRTS